MRRFVELSPVVSATAAQERAAFSELKSAQSRLFPQVYFSSQVLKGQSPLSAFGIPGLSGLVKKNFIWRTSILSSPSIWAGKFGWGIN